MKLNNKGMTAVEVLICFVIAAIIVVSMFKIVNGFKDKQEVESYKMRVTTYKNTVTKAIMSDVIKKGGIKSINTTSTRLDEDQNIITKEDSNGYTDTVEVNFNNNKSTTIVLHQANGGLSYIEYGSTKYNIPSISNLNFNGSHIILKSDFVNNEPDLKHQFLEINIGFNHPDLGNKFNAIDIVLPISDTYASVY